MAVNKRLRDRTQEDTPRQPAEPFCSNAENGDGGAVPAHATVQQQAPKAPEWLCACCGEAIPDPDVDAIDIVVSGSRLTGITPRGRAALHFAVDGVVAELAVTTIDYADVQRLVDAFTKHDLKCARHVEDL